MSGGIPGLPNIPPITLAPSSQSAGGNAGVNPVSNLTVGGITFAQKPNTIIYVAAIIGAALYYILRKK